MIAHCFPKFLADAISQQGDTQHSKSLVINNEVSGLSVKALKKTSRLQAASQMWDQVQQRPPMHSSLLCAASSWASEFPALAITEARAAASSSATPSSAAMSGGRKWMNPSSAFIMEAVTDQTGVFDHACVLTALLNMSVTVWALKVASF